jgi:hypothetical protein
LAGDDDGLIVMEVLALLKIIYERIFVIIQINNNEKLLTVADISVRLQKQIFFSISTGCGEDFITLLTVLNLDLF